MLAGAQDVILYVTGAGELNLVFVAFPIFTISSKTEAITYFNESQPVASENDSWLEVIKKS